jgi:hypothetical protein
VRSASAGDAAGSAAKAARRARRARAQEAVAAVAEEADESRRSNAANPIAIFAATLVVVAVALGIWWFGRSDPEPATGLGGDRPTEEPMLVDGSAPLPDLEAGLVTQDSQGNPVFAWKNPEPEFGDQYHYWLLGEKENYRVTPELQIVLPRTEFGDGAVCLGVQLLRGGKTGGEVEICER